MIALNATHRDIFFDAKLELLNRVGDTYDSAGAPVTCVHNVSNSYFVSTKYANANLSPYGVREIPQVEQAKVRGLRSRYWDTPAQPLNLKDIVWNELADLGNMDDLGAVRAKAKWGWGNIENWCSSLPHSLLVGQVWSHHEF